MSDQVKAKRWRAVFRNAAMWGLAWGGLGTIVAALFRLNDGIAPMHALLDGIGMGVRIGVVGALAGAAFSTFISMAYRGKRLSEISAAKFGFGGAVLAGAFVPAWMQTLNLLTGGGFVPFDLINGDIVMAAVFGGVTAFGSMLLAKRDEAKHPTTVQELLERMETESLGAGDPVSYETKQRPRSMQD
jgi:hypothetical protein